MITEFRGEYSWLSNFYACPIHKGDYKYSCVENAYQSDSKKEKQTRSTDNRLA